MIAIFLKRLNKFQGNYLFSILKFKTNHFFFVCYIGGTPGVSHTEASRKVIDSKVYTLEDFVHQSEIDHLNMFTLVTFFKKSKIGLKVILNLTYFINIYLL